jgi:hypothetical protein
MLTTTPFKSPVLALFRALAIPWIVLTCGAGLNVQAAPGHRSATASFQVTVQLKSTAYISTAGQPAFIAISKKDIAQGEVQVRAHLDVAPRSGGAALLTAQLVDPSFDRFRIDGLAAPVRRSGRSISVMIGSAASETGSGIVEYHFHLAPGARPGTHPWPLAMMIEAM